MRIGGAVESRRGGAGDTDEAEPTTPRVLAVLTSVLERLVSRNDLLAAPAVEERDGKKEAEAAGGGGGSGGGPLDAFRGVRAPNISIAKYLERIYKYTSCSPACFVVGYVYVDRLGHRHPASLVSSVNVHRLLLASVLVASKVLDDVHYSNAFYARVGGVTNPELNRMELELLFLLDFGVVVSSRVFESYCLHLQKEAMCHGGAAEVEGRVPFLVGGEVETPVEADGGDAQERSSSSSPLPHSFG